jgi:hypothetical protein
MFLKAVRVIKVVGTIILAVVGGLTLQENLGWDWRFSLLVVGLVVYVFAEITELMEYFETRDG